MSLPVRILVAGIVGGILVFFMGFFEHAVLNWGGREIHSLPSDGYFRELFKEEKLEHKVYTFPAMPDKGKGAEDQQRYADEWKAGPSGFLIIAPPGEEPMSGMTLVLELVTNIIAALIAAWIVSLLSQEKPFLWRWKVVVLMAIFGWVSLSASYGIWYRFPWPFIRDDLLCTILEWCVGGAAIAGIVTRDAKKDS
ncbi:MAG: hypothetical protein ACR2FY_22485 [Pirellulaceae bacterium]